MLDNYFPEVIAIAVSVLILIAVYRWQSTSKLTHTDVDNYITTLRAHIPQNWPDKEEFITRLRAWGYEDDGKPVYMLNLMRFNDTLADGFNLDAALLPHTANKHYEDAVMPMLLKVGGTPYFSGPRP